MPRFDVFQTSCINGLEFCSSKVRHSGENAPKAAIEWVKSMGLPKATTKDVRILGNATKVISASWELPSGDRYSVELIPVESTTQCKDCGFPKEYPNDACYGECEKNRQSEDLPLDLDEANELISSLI